MNDEVILSDDAVHDLQDQYLIFRCDDDGPEPQLSPDELRKLDDLADQVEVSRLIGMSVLKKQEALSEIERGEVADDDQKLQNSCVHGVQNLMSMASIG